MDTIVITGGNRLCGEVRISGAKNSALPILASTILGGGECTITNVPRVVDVLTMGKLLGILGAKVAHEGNRAVVKADVIHSTEAPYDLVKTMRASVLVLGPLVARWGEAKVSLPGGCAIGSRPVNLHLAGLAKLGADISIEHGYITAKAKRLKGARIYCDTPTVTGTENLIMAASLAEGAVLMKLREAGAEVKTEKDRVRLTVPGKLKGTDVRTLPFPGFPTDMQAQMVALMTIAEGTSVVTETVFESRFMHVEELRRMGADIRVEGNRLVVTGRQNLTGAPVMASDLRASAGLIVAGLAAEGVTEVQRVYHLDRGYEQIEEKLQALGAVVERRKMTSMVR
ncbi:MAG: UDP-N-acetylglucosamine 1-carboxyvinyltransferase [Nitrospirae bacterium]|nr:UDP-N-acetylglucosamine 1-carboxyvinyltransferase [Nitrospirota bacterium]